MTSIHAGSLGCASMLVLATLLSACGGGSSEPQGVQGGHTAGGEVAAQYQGPIGSTDTAKGAELYGMACAPCHQGGSAPALEGIGWTAAATRQQVREGEGGMPAITADRLPDEDLEAVLAHLQTIGGVR